jgi:tetratricopeptide (TPR) repeat protein
VFSGCGPQKIKSCQISMISREIYSDAPQSIIVNQRSLLTVKACQIPARTKFLRSTATYFRAKDYDSAVPWLTKATGATESAPDAYFYLGRIAREEGRMDEAIEHLKKSLAARPDQPDVLLATQCSGQTRLKARERVPFMGRMAIRKFPGNVRFAGFPLSDPASSA